MQDPNVRYTPPYLYRVEVEEPYGHLRDLDFDETDGIPIGMPIGDEIEERGWPIPVGYLVDDAQAARIDAEQRPWPAWLLTSIIVAPFSVIPLAAAYTAHSHYNAITALQSRKADAVQSLAIAKVNIGATMTARRGTNHTRHLPTVHQLQIT